MFGAPSNPNGAGVPRRILLPGSRVNRQFTPTTRGLIGRWAFRPNYKSGTNFRDLTGLKADAVASGAPAAQIMGPLGPTYLLNGTSQFSTIPARVWPSTAFSASCWIYYRVNPVNVPGIIDTWTTTASHVQIIGVPGGNLFCRIGNVTTGDTFHIGRSTDVISAGAWHHIAMIWTGGTTSASITVYVDGVRWDNADDNNSTFTAASSTSLAMLIGNQAGTASAFMDGAIDEVRIYNRALSLSEIDQLYRNPTIDYITPIDRIWAEIGTTSNAVTAAIAATDSDATTAAIAADNPISASIAATDSGATTAALAATVGAVTASIAPTDSGATTAAITATNPISASIAATDADGTTASLTANNPIAASIAATDADATTAALAATVGAVTAAIAATDSDATTAAIAATVGAVTGTLAATDSDATTAAITADDPISASIAATDSDGTTAAIAATVSNDVSVAIAITDSDATTAAITADNPIGASIAPTDSDATTAALAATVGAVTAAIAATDSGATTAAIAADNPIAASIAATDSDGTTAAIAATVTTAVTAVIAATDSDPTTAAIAASNPISASIAATDSDATIAALTATNPITGTLAATDSGATTAAITASPVVGASIAPTDAGATTAAITATNPISAAIAATDSAATTAALAVTVGPVTGPLAASDIAPTIGDIRGYVGVINNSSINTAGFAPAPLGQGPPASLSEAVPMSWMRRVVSVVNNSLQGKLNCTGFITLRPSLATTTLTDPRIGPFSQITLAPLSSNAAGVPWYISAQKAGQATISHDVSAALDRTFTYAIIG